MSTRGISLALVLLVGGCSAGGVSALTPQSGGGKPDAIIPQVTKITITPPTLSVLVGAIASVTVTEKGYRGTFKGKSTGLGACKGIAAWGPQKGKGPKLTVKVKGVSINFCSITFSDANKHTTRLHVTVQSPTPSPSPVPTPFPLPSVATLYPFDDPPDADFPESGVIGLNGLLFGTAYAGGYFHYGAVFAVTTSGAEGVVYSFPNPAGVSNTNGFNPSGSLTALDGLLYGTTVAGGNASNYCSVYYGTVFVVNPYTSTESVLHNFAGVTDGANPYAGLTLLNGLLYGTTSGGGTGSGGGPGVACVEGNGTVFVVNPSTGAESVLYRFAGGMDASQPQTGLTVFNGLLYGTTSSGGLSNNCTGGCGTVYEVNPSTGAETVLYRFRGGVDGANPAAAPTILNGLLYGTTQYGGANNTGTVFSVNPSTGVESVIYSFGAYRSSGAYPMGNLAVLNGDLWGTTIGVGGNGGLFEVSPSGAENLLYSFTAAGNAGPTGLTLINGVIYGTSTGGGRGCGSTGCGTVFTVTPQLSSAKKHDTHTVLNSPVPPSQH